MNKCKEHDLKGQPIRLSVGYLNQNAGTWTKYYCFRCWEPVWFLNNHSVPTKDQIESS